MLVAGFAAGCGVMAVVWALINSKKRKAVAAAAAQREETLQHINGLLADTDAVEAGFRAGSLSPENFRRQLGDRINIVMRALRTNMHLLDVFYVKFVEQQAHEYLRILENPERRKTGLVCPAAPPTGESPDFDRAAVAAADVGAPPPLFRPDTQTQPATLKVEEVSDAFEPLEKETLAIAPKDLWAPTAGDEYEPESQEEEDFEARQEEVEEEEEEFAPQQAEEQMPEFDEASFDEIAEEAAPEPDEAEADEVSFLEQEATAEPEADEVSLEDVAAESFSEPVAGPAPASAAQPQPAAGSDGWDTMDEFEASFEQFEVQAPSASASVVAEEQAEPEADFSESFEAPAISAPPVDDEDELVLEVAPPPPQKTAEEAMTETSSIDRSAIAAALAASSVKLTPLPIPPPPQYISVPEPQLEDALPPPPKHLSMPVPPQKTPEFPPPGMSIPVPPQKAPDVSPPFVLPKKTPEYPPPQASTPVSPPPPPPPAPQPKKSEDPDMLSGDDVVDAIDAFFKQK